MADATPYAPRRGGPVSPAAYDGLPPLRLVPDIPERPVLADTRPHAADRERDSALVAGVRIGDERALEALFHAHAAALCGFAVRIVRRREIAVEVVHDVFLKLWERRERLDVQDNPFRYLMRATRNRALDVVGREAFEQRWIEGAARELHAAPPPANDAAHDALERAELVEAVRILVEAMPERRRTVFELRWRDGLPYAEIAAVMGTSVKTVENQMTRALRDLREQLTSHFR